MILAITQARMTSTRLPGKVLLEAGGKSLLQMHVDRVAKSKLIDKHVLACSLNTQDDIIEAYCIKNAIPILRGDEQDVLDRFYAVAQKFQPKVIVRLTADCPLIDARVIDEVIQCFLSSALDYCSNTIDPTYPDGLDVEIFTFAALEKAWKEATLKSDREHVTPYIWKHSTEKGHNLFSSKNYSNSENFSKYRLTVDEKEDLDLIRTLVTQIGDDKPWGEYVEVINKLKLNLNSDFTRNAGYNKSLKDDKQL